MGPFKLFTTYIVSFWFGLSCPVFSQVDRNVTTNEHINYCQLVKAGQFYGQLTLDQNRPLTADQVAYFNSSMKLVYLDTAYHLEIDRLEFDGTGLFQSGITESFPPFQNYHPSHTDAYTIFHAAKEIYKYQHLPADCTDCRNGSLDTLNNLIMNKKVWEDYNDTWRIGPKDNRPLVHYEVLDFETFLLCYFIPDYVLPTVQRLNYPAPRLLCRQDTVVVRCKKEIQSEDPGLVANCMMGADIRELPLRLVTGIDNCPGAIYAVPYIASSPCGTDTCQQYFIIKNESPEIMCPPDAIVECESDIVAGTPNFTSSCGLAYDVEISDPILISGVRNCPGAIYQITYQVTDTCGRTTECAQIFTLENNPPIIECPADTVVECIDQDWFGLPKVETSCDLPYRLDYIGPTLVSGKHNCPGAIYEVRYVVTDSCGRQASCIQRISIDNAAPVIVCPEDKKVRCASDIKADSPRVLTRCGHKYTVLHDGPKLMSGTPECPGARYKITYTAIDDCGRIAICDQVFTIGNPGPLTSCWPDTIVECVEDIDIKPPVVTTSCSIDYDQHYDGPTKLAGIDNCPGTVYEISWVVTDACGREVACKQLYTISNDAPQIQCPKDTTVANVDDIKPGKATATVSCALGHNIDVLWPPVLVSGDPNCPGAVYNLIYTVTDVCGRSDSCIQKFTISERSYDIDCPPDRIVKCPEDIKPEPMESWLTGATRPAHISDPAPVKGIPCTYEIKYYYDLECDSTAVCIQRFTLDTDPPRLSCPPDVVIKSLNEVFDKTVGITTDCNLGSTMEEEPLKLTEGTWGEDGSEYMIQYLVRDECGAQSSCIQHIELKNVIDTTITRTPCECLTASRERWLLDSRTSYMDDVKSLMKKYSIAKLQGAALDAELYDLWLSNGTLGTSATYVAGIKLKDVFTTIKDMSTAIQIAEELVNGSSGTALTVAGSWLATEGTKRALGTGSIGAVYQVIKSLKDFADYLDKEIVELNIKMFANNYVDRDRSFFDVHHFLKKYAQIENTSVRDWNTIKIREALASYAHNELNVDLGDRSQWSTDQRAYNLVATAANRFLHDICIYYCRTKKIQEQLEKLRIQKSLIERYAAVQNHILSLQREECEISNATLVETTPGNYECVCDEGYKLSPDRAQCIPFTACGTVPYTEVVFTGRAYECDCIEGYEWNASKTECVKRVPDCSEYYPNTTAKWNSLIQDYECDCMEGYEWSKNEKGCVEKAPDCSDYYENTEAVWNPIEGRYECDCKEGFAWNNDRSACVSDKPNCESYYPNTTAVWNRSTNEYECDCKEGYRWNEAGSDCIKQISGEDKGYYVIKISGSGFRKAYGSAQRISGYHIYIRYMKEGENIHELIAKWKKDAQESSIKACKSPPPLCPCAPSPSIWTSGPNYSIMEYSEKNPWEKYKCEKSNINTRQPCIRWKSETVSYDELPCN